MALRRFGKGRRRRKEPRTARMVRVPRRRVFALCSSHQFGLFTFTSEFCSINKTYFQEGLLLKRGTLIKQS